MEPSTSNGTIAKRQKRIDRRTLVSVVASIVDLASNTALAAVFAITQTTRPIFSESVAVNLLRFVFLLVLTVSSAGCRFINHPALPRQLTTPNATVPNPLPVPALDRMLVMDEVSDEIDKYLPILKEERPRLIDGLLSEGWIETRPTIGSQIFEPWKRDSRPGFEKLHSTMQTIRRFAKVRVIPTGSNYLVDLRVYKELEDLQQPLNSNVSGRPLRFDNTLDKEFLELFEVTNRGWIPLGRDFDLEQRILQGITARFAEISKQNNSNCLTGNCEDPIQSVR